MTAFFTNYEINYSTVMKFMKIFYVIRKEARMFSLRTKKYTDFGLKLLNFTNDYFDRNFSN